MSSLEKQSIDLFNYVKKEIDLIEFLETYIGCDFQKNKSGRQAKCKCPMPHHKDSKASFNVKLSDTDGVWQYYCFGCNSGGTIIDFCKEYYDSMTSPFSVLKFLSEKYDLEKLDGIDFSNYNKKSVDFKKKMECSHILASNQCRKLLVKDFAKHHEWVSNIYRQMNEALEKEDMLFIENVPLKAMKRMKM